MIAGNERDKSEGHAMPPADFSGFIVSLAHAVMVHMGEMPDPATGAMAPNYEQARYTIDLIDMFVEKTRGNLTQEENMLLQRVSSDLKLKFVRRGG